MSRNKACNNSKRACMKMFVIIAAAVALIAALGFFIDDRAVDELKHTLDLWTIVTLVVIINLVCFVCFLVLSSAYHWVKSDLKSSGDIEDID